MMGSNCNLEEMNSFMRQLAARGKDPYAKQCDPPMRYRKEVANALPIFFCPPYEDRRNLEWRKKVEACGIAVMSCSELGFKSVKNIGDFGEYDPTVHTLDAAVPTCAHGDKTISHSELASKEILKEYGIAVPKQVLVESEGGLASAVKSVGFPLVMKISSPDILHKSDGGGVKLNITNAGEAADAYSEILRSCASACPDAKIEGVLVQEMAKKGLEMIVGIVNDEVFGPMLLVGFGGVSVEIYKDTALSPCPVNAYEAQSMLSSLKAYRLLTGFRGQPACDTDALIDTMVKVSEFAAERRNSLKEMDINPVILYEKGHGVTAADAVIVEYKQKPVL
jgi:acyl-CoA synthetase (NDP forming)